MILYYRLPGFLAVIALAIYVPLTLAGLALIRTTLTLPGIAGFLLSIGMAVDANIIIFERLKEELRLGKTIAFGEAEARRRGDGELIAKGRLTFAIRSPEAESE